MDTMSTKVSYITPGDSSPTVARLPQVPLLTQSRSTQASLESNTQTKNIYLEQNNCNLGYTEPDSDPKSVLTGK